MYLESYTQSLKYLVLYCYYLQVEVGSTLRLDCPVTQLSDPGAGASVMLWKKGHRVLTAGSIKVTPHKMSGDEDDGHVNVFQVRRDPRMSLLGTDLAISRVGVHDGGLYRSDNGHIPDMTHDI